VVFLFLTVPWHWATQRANPAHGHPVGFMPTPGNVHGFAWFYFVNDQFARYTNHRVPHDYDTVPLVLFWALVAVWMLPWSAFLFKAAARVPLWRGIKREELPPELHPWLFCGIWPLVILIFFSFSTRQEYYVLPALPALALLIGAWLAAEHHASYSVSGNPPVGEMTHFAQPPLQVAVEKTPALMLRSGRRIAVALLIGGLAAAGAALFLALRYAPPDRSTDIATLFRQNPNDYALSFGHFLDLRMNAMGIFRWPLVITALALIAGTAGNYFFRKRRRPGTANMFLTGMACAILIASWFALVTFSPMLTSATLAWAIAPEDNNAGQSPQPEQPLVVVNGEYEDASTLNFYLQQPLHILHEPSSDLWFGSFWPDAPHVWETPDSLAAQWQGERRIFLWTKPS
jgi:hypothetical protein